MTDPEEPHGDGRDLFELSMWLIILVCLVVSFVWWLMGGAPRGANPRLESERGQWSPGELRTLVVSVKRHSGSNPSLSASLVEAAR